MHYKVYKNTDPNDKQNWVTIYFNDKVSIKDNLAKAFTDKVISKTEYQDAILKLAEWPEYMISRNSYIGLTYHTSAYYSKEA